MLSGPANWHIEPITPDLAQCFSVQDILYAGSTAYQRVELIQSGSFGRCLVLDGKTQSSEADEFVYHESLVHPALVAHPRPETVCIAGGGEGATAREVLRHASVRSAVMVDLDREVVELCRRFLPGHHQGAFDSPRLSLHFGDASAFLERHQGRFDVIILDLPDPLEGGPAYLLYTVEFYRLLKERLAPGGLLVTQSGPASILNLREVFTAINHTLRAVFPVVASYSVPVQSFGESWGFTVGSLGPDPSTMQPQAVDQALARNGVQGLRHYDGTSHQALFSLPLYVRQALEQETRTITRETPLFVF